MKTNLNQVTLIGRIAATPVNKEYGRGRHYTKLSIATNEMEFGKIKTEFHTVVLLNELSLSCREHLIKGGYVYIKGKLKTEKWEDNNHVLHTATEIIGLEVLILDSNQPTIE